MYLHRFIIDICNLEVSVFTTEGWVVQHLDWDSRLPWYGLDGICGITTSEYLFSFVEQ